MTEEKETVREFYNRFGWLKDGSGVYYDTVVNVDSRLVLNFYRYKICMRVKRFLKKDGKFFLDAGCGANPYLEGSASYECHVCVDLSRRGLLEARSKLNGKGAFLIGDLTRLPFRDEVFDAVLAAHVLYHIPKDEQASAIREMSRTLKLGATCVILYTRGKSWFTIMFSQLPKLLKLIFRPVLRTRLQNKEATGYIPPLYVYAHDFHWFQKNFPEIEARCWMLLDSGFTKSFIPNNMFGLVLVKAVLLFEKTFPHTLAKISSFPMFVIRKQTQTAFDGTERGAKEMADRLEA